MFNNFFFIIGVFLKIIGVFPKMKVDFLKKLVNDKSILRNVLSTLIGLLIIGDDIVGKVLFFFSFFYIFYP